jgi:hypothetical protein
MNHAELVTYYDLPKDLQIVLGDDDDGGFGVAFS